MGKHVKEHKSHTSIFFFFGVWGGGVLILKIFLSFLEKAS